MGDFVRCSTPIFSATPRDGFVPCLPSFTRTDEAKYVRREVAEAAYREYERQYGNRQTFDKVHDRGGFAVDELLSLLTEALSRHLAAASPTPEGSHET